ncbi:hypothetical protein QUB56_35720 [Microcoleus sp. AR_TQ3_B6]|uniref:hypothetical protein n=1 Tax=Microcoleus sp. AR_TQ3_B6 TaxID=3055284 RepID=UPI002FD44768
MRNSLLQLSCRMLRWRIEPRSRQRFSIKPCASIQSIITLSFGERSYTVSLFVTELGCELEPEYCRNETSRKWGIPCQIIV